MIFQTSIRTCSILIFRGVRSCYFWGAKHVWIRGIDVMRRPCQGDSYTWQHPTLQHNVGRTSPVEEKHPFSENILYCLYTYLNYYVIHTCYAKNNSCSEVVSFMDLWRGLDPKGCPMPCFQGLMPCLTCKKNTWFAIGKFQSRMYFCQIHAVEVVHSFKCLKVCRYCRWFFFPTLCFSFLSTDGCILEITYTWMYFNCLFLLLVAVANRRWLQVVATIVALQWNLWWDVRWKHQ